MANNINSNSKPNLPSLKQVRERLGMTQEEFACVFSDSGTCCANKLIRLGKTEAHALTVHSVHRERALSFAGAGGDRAIASCVSHAREHTIKYVPFLAYCVGFA